VTQTATAEQARGEHDAAAELAIEAVRLTSDREPALLHQRAELAATSLVASGDIGHAATLLEHTAGRAVPPAVRAELLLLLARLRSHTDHAAAAVHLLSLAMSEAPEPELVGRLAAELAGVWVQAGYLEEAAHELTLAQESADGPATRTVGLMLDLALGRPGDGATLVTATNADPLLPAVAQPLYAAAAIDMAAGRLEDARTTLEGLQRDSALAGDDLTAGHVMCRLSELECITGSTETALQYADTAATMARRTGQRVLLPFALARRALALGRLGRLDQARDAAQEGVAVAEATGIRRAEWLNGWALGFAALSEGDHEQAARLLVPITQASYKAGYLEPAFLRWVPDTVEALVSVGDVSLASRLLEPFAEHSARLGRTWAVALAERSHALVLGHGRARTQALAHAQQALTGYTTAADPFELARTMLVAGLLYRRQHREAEAGELLHGALELFDQLGAHTWATRLRHDLAAVPSQSRPITPVELRVAELASTGLTNRQIATQLFISPKTVESHLSSVYRKLGIRSRAGLAHKLDTLGGSPAARG
jgi:DNA-binding CsgD family transcriptional regulator